MTLKYPAINTQRGRKSLTNRTLWCGPFAVAMITGLDYDDAHAKIVKHIRRAIIDQRKKRGVTGYRLYSNLPTFVKGTYEHQIERTLNKLGVKTKLVYSKLNRWPTLLTFSRDHTVKGKTYIVVAGHHWVTIKDGILYHSHHDPMPIEDAPRYRMAKVECWAEVRPRPAAILEPVPEPDSRYLNFRGVGYTEDVSDWRESYA